MDGALSAITDVANTVRNLPLQQIAADLRSASSRVNTLVNDPALDQSLKRLNTSMAELEKVAIVARGTHQWTASLEEMVIHTLAFDLANRLPDGMVILPGQAKPPAMRSVYVTFEDLAAGPDQKFVLDARWSLAPGGPELARHERIVIDMPSMESAEIAKAMSSALAQLADRMAPRF